MALNRAKLKNGNIRFAKSPIWIPMSSSERHSLFLISQDGVFDTVMGFQLHYTHHTVSWLATLVLC